MTDAQVTRFGSTYAVEDHLPNTWTGFSATLLKNATSGEYVLSFRSTEYEDQHKGGDWDRDGAFNEVGADYEISQFGFAVAQIGDMEAYYRQLRASGKLPEGATFRVTGYSLGGHLATVFAEAHQNDAGFAEAVTFNAPGRGVIANGSVADLVQRAYDALRGPGTDPLRDYTLRTTPENSSLYTVDQYRGGESHGAGLRADVLAGLGTAGIGIATPSTPALLAGGKITQVFGLADFDDRTLVANAGVHSVNTLKVFIEDQPLTQGTGPIAILDNLLGLKSDYGTTHSITLIADAVAAGELLQKVHSTADQAVLNGIFATGSNERGFTTGLILGFGGQGRAESNSLERVIEALAELYGANLTAVPNISEDGEIPVGLLGGGFGNLTNRNAYYEALKLVTARVTLQGGGTLASFNEQPASNLAVVAKQDTDAGLSYRYALVEGNGFAVVKDRAFYLANNHLGADDKRLDLASAGGGGAITDQYIDDRAAYVERLTYFNVKNARYDKTRSSSNPKDLGDSIATQFDGEDVVWFDISSGITVQRKTFSAALTTYRIFGDSGANVLLGGELLDRLYGGAGGDVLMGGGGDDYLEGGAGVDLYRYTARGGAQGGNDGADTLLDVDGRGVVRYEFTPDGSASQSTVIAGVATEQSATQWLSADGKFRFDKQGADLVATILGDAGGTVTFKDFDFAKGATDGYMGIRLANAFSTLPTTTNALAGDKAPVDGSGDPGIQYEYDTWGNQQVQTGDEPRADALYGRDNASDHIRGLTGDDVIFGDVTQLASPGPRPTPVSGSSVGMADFLEGGAGRDIITSGEGDDWAEGGTEADIVSGNAGHDTLWADASATQTKTVAQAITEGESGSGASGQGDLISGDAGDDRIVGAGTGDFLAGGEGRDLIVGGLGDDNIYGDVSVTGAVLDWTAARSETISGGTTVYAIDTTGMALAGNTAAAAGGADVIYGGAGADWIFAGAGDDFVSGGNTTGDANVNDDVIFGEAGSDILIGGSGKDALHGDSASVDAIPGLSGDDYLDGGAGDDILRGGKGNDILIGGEGNDQLIGNEGDDLLIANQGEDILLGGAGKDTYVFNRGDGIEVIQDTPDDPFGKDASVIALGDGVTRSDVKFRVASLMVDLGQGDAIHINGFSPDDPLSTRVLDSIQFADGTVMTYADVLEQGFDLDGTEGDDLITGTAVTDRVSGFGGNDDLRGGAGNDTILGGAGRDTINGGEGDDTLSGGEDNDVLEGGAGADALAGDAGHDVLIGGEGDDSVTGGAGADFLEGSAGADAMDGGTEADTLLGGAGDDSLDGGAGEDTLIAGDGNDLLTGGAGVDQLSGGAGEDVLAGGTGDEALLSGGLGGDTYLYNLGDGNDTIEDQGSGEGTDTLVFGEGIAQADVSLSRTGNGDIVARLADSSTVTLRAQHTAENRIERIVFDDGSAIEASTLEALPANLLLGNAGNDTITGSAFNETIEGRGGDDTLEGAGGADTLIGGAGNDTYRLGFGSGAETGIEAAGQASVLALAAGIALAELRAERTGNHLTLTLRGTNDSFTISDYFSTTQGWTVAEAGGASQTAQQLFNTSQAESQTRETWKAEARGRARAEFITAWAVQGYSQADADTLVRHRYPVYTASFSRTEQTTTTIYAGGGGTQTQTSSTGYATFTSGGVLEHLYQTLNLAPYSGDDPMFSVGPGSDTSTSSSQHWLKLNWSRQFNPTSTQSWSQSYPSVTYQYRIVVTSGHATASTSEVPGGVDPSSGSTDAFKLPNYINANETFRETTQTQWDVTGGASANVIQGAYIADGGGGNDTVDGLVLALGGDGNDVVTGRSALYGEAGDDRLTFMGPYRAEQALLDGGSGNDVLKGGSLYTLLMRPGSGDDLLIGQAGANIYRIGATDEGAKLVWDEGGVETAGTLDVVELPSAAIQSVLGFQWSLLDPGSEVGLALGSLHLTLDVSWGANTTVRFVQPVSADGSGVGIERIRLGDGSTITYSQLLGMAPAMPSGVPVNGTAGNDTLQGGANGEFISGLAGDDVIHGAGGDDFIDGGAGDDLLSGGEGSDVYLFRAGNGDDVIENADADGSVDRLRLTNGVAPQDVTLEYDNDDLYVILGTGEEVKLVGWVEADPSRIGRIEFDNGTVWLEADILQAAQYVGAGLQITGTPAAETLTGSPGADVILGLGGNDNLIGRAGDDQLEGGAGDDTYVVGNAGDNVVENPNEGIDTVQSSVNWTLHASVENLVLTGIADIDGTGNALANVLTGNSGLNVLAGGSGDDTYHVGAGDAVAENLDEGVDTVVAGVSFTLGANLENLTLTGTAGINGTGNGLDNALAGNAGDNALDGGAGADAMAGGAGDDVYVVDDLGDTVTESAGEGADTVRSSISTILGANLENLTLTGAGNVNGTGNSLANTLAGNAGNNLLSGGAGNDRYVFDVDFGHDTIADSDATTGNVDAIIFGTGVSRAGVVASRSGMDLVLTAGSKSVTVSGWFGSDADKVERVEFSDAVVWDAAAIRELSNINPEVANPIVDQAATEDGPFSFTLAANTFADADLAIGDTLTLSARLETGAALPDWLAFGAQTRTFSGTPANGDVGPIGIRVTATDQFGATASTGFTLATANTNDAPTVANEVPDRPAQETQAFNYVVPVNTFHDADLGDQLVYNAMLVDGNPLPAWLGFDPATRTFSGTPPAGSEGYFDVRLTATDIAGAAVQDDFRIAVSIIQVVDGTSGDDVLIGGELRDRISGFAGSDSLQGLGSDDELDGGPGADTMAGGAGDDTYIVDDSSDTVTENANDGTDRVQSSASFALAANVENLTLTGTANVAGTGNALENVLLGNAGGNLLAGQAGADVLDGGAGADSLWGGARDDTYVLDDAGDVVTEAVTTTTTYQWQNQGYWSGTTWVSNWVQVQSGSSALAPAAGVAPVYSGGTSSGYQTLDQGYWVSDGEGGANWVPVYVSREVSRTVVTAGDGVDTVGSSVSHSLTYGVENLTLTGTASVNGTGNAANNVLTGNSGDNVLDGGAGADTMAGGAGNDTYVVDNAADAVTENPNEGADTVMSSVTFTLGAHLENLTLTGSTAINGTGNALANVLTGNAGNNVLDGGAGADAMAGGAGNDTYYVGAGDTVTENANEGSDLVYVDTTHALGANIENLTLTGTGDVNGTGNGLANLLTGNAGKNVLDGGTGADAMAGGAGDDTYIVDATGDVVIENANEGVDLVQTSVTFTLSANVENLVLTGSGSINGTGNALANVLTGNAGNNVLDGGGGADAMAGGAGNDTYVVDDAGDVVAESANEGTDAVQSSISYVLGNDLEHLRLSGSGNIDGTGNSLANLLTGNAGNNVLDGGAGADTMAGGAGNDTYVMDNAADTVTENASEGADTVLSSVAFTLGANLEILTLTGTANINGTGNALNNVLTGNSGDNVLDGGAGADAMAGGAGNDIYHVGAGDTVTESIGEGTDLVYAGASFVLGANVENLVLTGTGNINGTGNALANDLAGNSGNNVLDGGTGTDSMAGGDGNDTYIVDDAGDVAIESAGGGTDSVQASVTYALGSEVEHLTLTGSAIIDGTGNGLSNVLAGNTGANVLDGGSGTDWLWGGTGNDGYVVDNAGDVVTEAVSTNTTYQWQNQGYWSGTTWVSNWVQAQTGSSVLAPTAGVAAVYSGGTSSGYQTLDQGYWVSDGEGGANWVPVYVSREVSRTVVTAGDGADTVSSSVSHALTHGVENLTLTGTGNINGTGNSLNNVLTGNAGNNTLAGGAGDDTYHVGAGDAVTEAANEGTDTVYSTASFTLGANVENLTLTGTGTVNATGNTLNNVLTGNSGNNTLDGGAGADALAGGAGDDAYVVDNSGDAVTESANEGADTVQSSISYTLGANVENLTLTGTGNINATGNALANVLTGNAGNNVLAGGAGNDEYLIGSGSGQDTITENDATAGNVDTIRYAVGIAPGSVAASRAGMNLVLTRGADSVTVTGWYGSAAAKVEQVAFADGTVWDATAIRALANLAPVVANPIADQTATTESAFNLTLAANAFTDGDAAIGETLTLSASRADGSALPGWLTFNAATGAFTGTPGEGDVGALQLRVTATDSVGASVGDTFDLAVLPVNHAPTVANPIADRSTAEDAAFSFTVPVNAFADVDAGDSLSYTATKADDSALPSWLTFNAATRTFSGTPVNGDVGVVSLKVKATDAGGLQVSDTFDLAVGNVNDAPVVANPLADQSATETVAFSFTVSANAFADVDAGDTLTYSAARADGSALPGWLAFNAGTRSFSGTPGGADVGSLSIRLTATDQSGASANDVFDLGVQYYGIQGTSGNDTLTGTGGNDNLFGLAGNDLLSGLAGADLLDGGSGTDWLWGGSGNDGYVLDNAGDVVTEAVTTTTTYQWQNQGYWSGTTWVSNWVQAQTGSSTLAPTAGVAALYAGGTSSTTQSQDHGYYTMVSQDQGYWQSDGEGGSYWVSNWVQVPQWTASWGNFEVSRTVVTAGDGVDTVSSSVSHSLTYGVENLSLTGTANINGTGNELANHILGNGGNNVLTGGAGMDVLEGGAGDDTLSDAAGSDAGFLAGGAGNDTLNGGGGRELLAGGAGNDTIHAGDGSDIVAFNRGDGQDSVTSGGSVQDNILSLGGGIRYADLKFRKVSDDLVLDTGQSESVTLKNWYASGKRFATLQVVIEASADYNAGSSDATLNQKVQRFNMDSLATAFDQARAADPLLTEWALSSALTQFHLGGSDTEALGGDLAYYLGKNGSLATMGFDKALEVLGASQFGQQSQAVRPWEQLQQGVARLNQ